MEKFAIGAVIGGVLGALLVTNNYKMRSLVKKGQEEVQAKLDTMMDEKLQKLEKKGKALKDKAEESVKEVTKKVKKESK